MTDEKKTLLLSAATPWLSAALVIAVVSILVMVGSDIGASSERAKIANDCRATGAFTVKRTGFKCEVMR